MKNIINKLSIIQFMKIKGFAFVVLIESQVVYILFSLHSYRIMFVVNLI